MFFGTSSPSSMDSRVASTMAMTRETDAAATSGIPTAASGRLEEPAHRWFHDVAGQEGGQGDAQLAAGKLGGQGLQALEQGNRTGVAVVDGPLDSGLVKGDQGKFDGDEEAGAGDQQ